MVTEGKWEAGYNPEVTGPTTPAPRPLCGLNWPYHTVNVGTETIAIVPAQAATRIRGQRSEPLIGSAEANANLIVSCVIACKSVNSDNPQAVAESIKEMYEALKMAQEVMEISEVSYAAQGQCGNEPYLKIIQALAKAEGR